MGTTGYLGQFRRPTGEARFAITRPTDLDQFGFLTEVTGRRYRFHFSGDDLAVETVKRALGCVILALMPDEGLDAALSGLADTCEFYVEDRDLPISAPVSVIATGFAVESPEEG
jgi:hypothetical protein